MAERLAGSVVVVPVVGRRMVCVGVGGLSIADRCCERRAANEYENSEMSVSETIKVGDSICSKDLLYWLLLAGGCGA